MSDSYVLELAKDRDTRIAELERCRSEVERFVAEVERLTRERDEAREDRAALAALLDERLEESNHLRGVTLRYEQERDEWKARAEAAEADNAALVETLNLVENDLSDDRYDDAHRRTIVLLKKEHPGAALLGRLRGLEYTVKEMELDANALWEASARLERLRAAEKVVEAVRSSMVDREPSRLVLERLAAYDALKEGGGMSRTEKLEMLLRFLARDMDDQDEPTLVAADTMDLVGDLLKDTPTRLVTTTPAYQGVISLVPEKP